MLQALITLLKGMAKEKVVRVAFRPRVAHRKVRGRAVALGCAKVVGTVKLHSWADEELIAALRREERLAEVRAL